MVFWRQRGSRHDPFPVPLIERPRPSQGVGDAKSGAGDPQKPSPASTSPLPDAVAEARDEGLSLALEARQLSITLTSATLAYRVTLSNNGKKRLKGLAVTGDLTSAHSSVPKDVQLAGPAGELAPCHEIPALAPGETTQVTGEFRLPFALIQPIRKDAAVLFVPLARLRVEAAEGGNGAALLTALVGQRSREPGGGLQPFRLDRGPRIYRDVTQRIFS